MGTLTRKAQTMLQRERWLYQATNNSSAISRLIQSVCLGLRGPRSGDIRKRGENIKKGRDADEARQVL